MCKESFDQFGQRAPFLSNGLSQTGQYSKNRGYFILDTEVNNYALYI